MPVPQHGKHRQRQQTQAQDQAGRVPAAAAATSPVANNSPAPTRSVMMKGDCRRSPDQARPRQGLRGSQAGWVGSGPAVSGANRTSGVGKRMALL